MEDGSYVMLMLDKLSLVNDSIFPMEFGICVDGQESAEVVPNSKLCSFLRYPMLPGSSATFRQLHKFGGQQIH